MNKHQQMVKEFMQTVGQETPEKPTLDEDVYPFDLRARLILEEAEEFDLASSEQDWIGMIDALCDILYVTYGAAVAMGIDLEPFFAEVQRANMDKLGGPIREDGKQLKPEGWKPPDIEGILKIYTETKQPTVASPCDYPNCLARVHDNPIYHHPGCPRGKIKG